MFQRKENIQVTLNYYHLGLSNSKDQIFGFVQEFDFFFFFNSSNYDLCHTLAFFLQKIFLESKQKKMGLI